MHDLPCLEAIETAKKLFKTKHIAVFDTSFHSAIPEKAKIYAIPYKFYKQGIKRYGFHGTSHQFVSKGLKGKVITCHLGSGCSIAAIKNNKCIDTSMGFTPLEGLVMSTRSGDIDPSILFYLIKKKKYSIDKIDKILNQESGLLGISGISKDMKKLIKSKNPRAKLAIDIFIYKIIKYIGAYTAVLQGLDTLVFTGGIGENSATIRKKITTHLRIPDRKVKTIKTDEEKAINDSILTTLKS